MQPLQKVQKMIPVKYKKNLKLWMVILHPHSTQLFIAPEKKPVPSKTIRHMNFRIFVFTTFTSPISHINSEKGSDLQ